MATPLPANVAPFTLDEIVAATGGRVLASGLTGAVGVVTDSRAVTEGSLFVALRGENHDAHTFVPGAVRAGAAVVIVDREVRVDPGVSVVEVKDTERAVGDLAQFHRRRWGKTVVGITGSVGKTTTKDITVAALSATGLRVHGTSGNLNNLVGVPLTLLGLVSAADVAVIEMGTNRPGEIARLAQIAQPQVGLVTAATAAHTEGLGSIEGVAREKGSLLRSLPMSGTAIVNADDSLLATELAASPASNKLRFGRASDADVRLAEVEIGRNLVTRFDLGVAGRGTPLAVTTKLLGEPAALNASAAIAVVLALGRDLEQAVRGISTLQPGAGRMMPVAIDDILIVDDSYNASPHSMRIALDTAKGVATARGGSLVAVLGDMRELGERSHAEHGEVIEHAVRRARKVVVCGPEMDRGKGDLDSVVAAVDALAAARLVRELLKPGDVVLVKGSRAMNMERVVEELQRRNEGGS